MEALQFNADEHEFMLDVNRKCLRARRDFDKGNWPDFADPTFGRRRMATTGSDRIGSATKRAPMTGTAGVRQDDEAVATNKLHASG